MDLAKVKSIEALDLTGRRVLVRADLNVPVKAGTVTSDARIRASVPTLELALGQGAAVVVASHLGRPEEGRFDPDASLAPVAARLGELLGRDVTLLPGIEAMGSVASGEIALLENVRFFAGEKANDDALAQRLAAQCDVFVNDAFGTAHRAQASTHGVARFAPEACAGLLLAAELDALSEDLTRWERTLLAREAEFQALREANDRELTVVRTELSASQQSLSKERRELEESQKRSINQPGRQQRDVEALRSE